MNLARRHFFALAATSLLILSAGCSDRDPAGLEVARAPIRPLVFDDAFADVYFQPFSQTHVEAVEVDSVFAYNGFSFEGARSLKVEVPPAGSALGIYAGGVLTSVGSRDLADFNALTFYARAEHDVTLDIVGFGNDNTGTSLYEAGRGLLPLTGDWTFFVVPIPNPAKLIAERGLFTFAEGAEESYPEGYHIWFDEIRFAKLGNIEVFRPIMRSVNRSYFIGSTVAVGATSTVFLVDGGFVPVDHSPNYFDFTSSDPSVAVVERGGRIRVTGVGEARITAKLQDADVNGVAVVRGYEPPDVAAPVPTRSAANVISMFSGAYDDVPIETWRADWAGATTQLQDYRVGGNLTKLYTALNFVGVLFENPTIDASEMTHFHVDVYAPSGTNFKIKLVSFPAGQETGAETPDLTLDGTTTPAFQSGDWVSLDVPLTDFQTPPEWDWSAVGQLIFSTTDAQLVLLDNVYWYK